MAHFAQLDANNVVVQVIVIDTKDNSIDVLNKILTKKYIKH